MSAVLDKEIGPDAAFAISAAFERIKRSLALAETAYVAIDKADDGDEGINVGDAIMTLRAGLDGCRVVREVLDHLSLGSSGNIKNAISLLAGDESEEEPRREP